MRKVFILGDIHGRLKALTQVFERSGFDYEHDTCIFVGDIVDRGEEPFECIEFMLCLMNRILIRGNHDENFHHFIRTGYDMFNGEHGSRGTIVKWQAEKDRERRELIESYFESTDYYYVDVKNRIFVHGGFDNLYLIDDQEERDFCWDRHLWEQALTCSSEQRIPNPNCFSEIYIGHTPTINYGAKEEITMAGIILKVGEPITTPMYMGGIWNMDTGAGFLGGKLSMMNVDTKEIFQSDFIKDLYGIK